MSWALPPGHLPDLLGGLEVAMDDPLGVGVMHRSADGHEQAQPLARHQAVVVAERRDGDAADQLHPKNGSPESVAPASRTRAMLGWSISARACRSTSKRATTCLVSMPGLSTFSATLRRSGCCCSARKTRPKPPSPICSSSLYEPRRVPALASVSACRGWPWRGCVLSKTGWSSQLPASS